MPFGIDTPRDARGPDVTGFLCAPPSIPHPLSIVAHLENGLPAFRFWGPACRSRLKPDILNTFPPADSRQVACALAVGLFATPKEWAEGCLGVC